MIRQIKCTEAERECFQLRNPFAPSDEARRLRESIEQIAGEMEPKILAGETCFLIRTRVPLHGLMPQINAYFSPSIKLRYVSSYPQVSMVCVE